jgi:hypothetical protein
MIIFTSRKTRYISIQSECDLMNLSEKKNLINNVYIHIIFSAKRE